MEKYNTNLILNCEGIMKIGKKASLNGIVPMLLVG
jgi:hypothetical protein